MSIVACTDCFGTGEIQTSALTWRTCPQCCPGVEKVGRSDHPAELVSVGDRVAWIDVGLVPVIRALWMADIETKECCQNCVDGMGYIVFDPDCIVRFPGMS